MAGKQNKLSENQIKTGLNFVIYDGIASQIMVTLTSGIFLAAFALQLGATNYLIGLLAAIPPIAQLIQIPSVYLVEKVRNRKLITIINVIFSRFFLFFIAIVPLVFSRKIGLSFLFIGLFMHSLLASISGVGWSSWMRDLIPQNILGTFFSKRMFLATSVGLFLSLIAGFFLDYISTHYKQNVILGYSIIFIIGFISGMIGIIFLNKTPEPKMPALKGELHLIKLIIEPFKDINFRNLIMFLGSWNFAVNLAVPFFTVYMLKTLKLNLSIIVALTILSQIVTVMFLNIWGRFTDKYSNKSVLRVCGPLFIICFLAWIFTKMPDKYFLTIPLLVLIHIVMGISTAGVSLSSSNIGLKLAPMGKATAYLSASGLVNSVAAATGPMFGGLFADYFAKRELAIILKWKSPFNIISFQTLDFRHWDFFFLLAFIIGLYSFHRLSLVKEEGEVHEKVIFNELIDEVRRSLRTVSTVPGIRQMLQFPFFIIKRIRIKKENINKK